MSELKNQLTSYIELVFNNEQRFTEKFKPRLDDVVSLKCFYMGGSQCLAVFECRGYDVWQPNIDIDIAIKFEDFIEWADVFKLKGDSNG